MPEAAKRLLVVDDDEAVRTLASGVLRNAGYTVQVVNGGPEAVTALEKEPAFHALITDKDMPQLNGYDVVRRAAELAPAMAVVMMTGHAERLPPGLAQHIDACVSKPFKSPGELVETVQQAFEARAAKLEREEARATLERVKAQLKKP
jgi:CheY-like chemotaxis protein